MADKYWVGGSGSWSDSVHWATSSGGAGNTGVPVDGDNVQFDSNSNNGSYTVTGPSSFTAYELSINNPSNGTLTFSFGTLRVNSFCSFYGGSISGTMLELYGAVASRALFLLTPVTISTVKFGSTVGGTTWAVYDSGTLTQISGAAIIESGSTVSVGYYLSVGSLQVDAGGTLAANGTVAVHGSAQINGTLSGNGALRCYSSITFSGSITHSGNVELSDYYNSSVSLDTGSGTVVLGNLTLAANSANSNYSIAGANKTFATVSGTGSTRKNVTFSGSTTVTSFNLDGAAYSRLSLSGGTFTKSGGGTITVDYADVSGTTVSPAATWIAGSYTAVTTSTGWVAATPTFLFGTNF